MTISTQHVLQRYMVNAFKWEQTQEQAAEEFSEWLEAVRNGADR